MKFALVIAGLCGVALAGGIDQRSETRNQDYGQHTNQVYTQQHNTYNGDTHRDGADGRGNGDQAWHAGSNLVLSNQVENRDQEHRDQNRFVNQNQVGFIPNVNQNYFNGGYSTGYVAQQTYPVGYVAQQTYPTGYIAQQTYPTGYVAQQTYQTGYVDQQSYPTGYVDQQTYPAGYVDQQAYTYTDPVVDPNQYSYGYYNDQSGNVYQYQNDGFYNYGPSSVVSQTYTYLPVSYNQVGTYVNQQGWNFHKFGSNDEAKKFNDQYRNRRGGNGHGDGQSNNQGNDHGQSYGNSHAIAYGVDVGSTNLRKDGGRDGKNK